MLLIKNILSNTESEQKIKSCHVRDGWSCEDDGEVEFSKSSETREEGVTVKTLIQLLFWKYQLAAIS